MPLSGGSSNRRLKHGAPRLVAATIALGVAAGLTHSNLRFNFTSSLPVGVYRRLTGTPIKGDLVISCLPAGAADFALSRGYVWRGVCPSGAAPVGKAVLAVAGDTVEETREGLLLNGHPVPNSRVVSRDSRGRPIPHYPFGRHILGPGQVWLFSPFHRMSFDGRYFGPTDMRLIRTRISPVLTTAR